MRTRDRADLFNAAPDAYLRRSPGVDQGQLETAGASRDWAKTKVSQTPVITGLAAHEAVAAAELQDSMLALVGQVKLGLGRKELWQRLDQLRAGLETRSGLIPRAARAGRQGEVLRALSHGLGA
jgi:hypothetical protein